MMVKKLPWVKPKLLLRFLKIRSYERKADDLGVRCQSSISLFQTGGFFVECGALDGELRSNTLTLERDYGWRGVLIEADPENLLEVVYER